MKNKTIVFILLIISPFIVYSAKFGDVDGNGNIDIRDYGKIKMHLLNRPKLTGDELKRADLDGKDGVNSRDLGLELKLVLGEDISKYIATPTPTPVPAVPRTITFVGGDVISTGYEGNEVLIKGGKVSTHSSYSLYKKSLGLTVNQKYAVSFDYYSKSGTNRFDVDIYPDSITQSYPSERNTLQVNLDATSTKQHYDWIFASNDSKIKDAKVALRFFDDIRGSGEKDVIINNVVLSKVSSKTYTNGTILGSLPTPSRKGYKFLGWYTSGSGGTKVTSETVVLSDMTLYARWGGTYDHVFIIGIDGLGDTYRTDKQKTEPNNKVNAVNFRRIFGDYAYRYNANTENITISAQNWSSIFNGVACETHGITNNIASRKTRNSNSNYLTIFYYLKKQNPNAKMTSIVNWNPINHGIIESDIGVKKIHKSDDEKVTSEVVSYVNKNKNDLPNLMFVHLCDVDHAAHANVKTKVPKCGKKCGGYSAAYYKQAQISDTQLGQMFDAINNTGVMGNSLFIVVADHGESQTSHGTKKSKNRDPEEDHVVVAVRGYTVNKMTLPKTTHNRDVSAIVLYALGIDRPEHFISTIPSGLFNK